MSESIPMTTSGVDALSSPESQKALLSGLDRASVYATTSTSGQKPTSTTLGKPEDDDDDGAIKLKPKLTLLNGCTVIVGSIIGSGIFVAPKGVLANTGSVGLSIVIWVLSGLYSLVGAFCFAELGCMIPKSGADYAYIMTSFGPFLAFLRLWIECIIVRPTSQAIVALTFALYALRPFYPDCDPPTESVKFLAVVCILILTFVNCWSVKWSTFVQDIFTYGKLIALALIICSGTYQLARGHTEHFTFKNMTVVDPVTGQPPLIEPSLDWAKVVLSFYSGLFAYNGWNYLNFIIEELIEPAKNLPKAIMISVVLVTVVYTMTIAAFHTTLSVQDVLSSGAVAVTFAERIFGGWSIVVPIFVAMSTFGGVNGILLTSSRLFYAGAEERQMPSLLSMIQISHLTPTPAVIAMCLLSLVYLLTDDIYLLINYVGFTSWLAIGIAVACVPYLRWKHPEWERPIKVHLFWPIIYIIATLVIITVPMLSEPKSTLMGCAIIATGVPVYWVFICWKSKPLILNKVVTSVTECLQKIMVVVPPERKNI
uniref:Y+L amino acid transporter 2 n=1 Tax=Aceria tosichella TaxID=561515 RepID=A0A6G1SJD0_9ACAR